MSEKPILYTAQMIAAMREGRKNVTRRVIKGIPLYYDLGKNPQSYGPGEFAFLDMADPIGTYPTYAKCPYGGPGDLLWVKETFGVVRISHPLIKQTLPMFDYTHYSKTEPDCLEKGYELLYKATQEIDPDFPIKWRSPRFMPKWVARTWLEVLNVRPERLQDISPKDCYAEGIESQFSANYKNIENIPVMPLIKRFKRLWDSINASPKPIYKTISGKKDIIEYVSYPWEAIQEESEYRGKPWHIRGNPWVWRIEFKEY